jgi:hypothetical protein
VGCPRIASVHLLRISGQWKFIESGQRMYIQIVVLKNNTSREEDKVCSYLLLEERSHGAWQHLAALGSSSPTSTSQLHKGQETS